MGPITMAFNKGAQRDAERRLADNQIWHQAYKLAREAGFDVNTADACAMRVIEEFREGRQKSLREIINRVIAEHGQP